MKNWKTTLCGAVVAAAQAISTYQGGHGWQGYAVAVAIAGFGFFAKDFNVTGPAQK